MVKKIHIRRTFTLIQELSMSCYPDMTPEEAVAYEQDLDLDTKLEFLAGEIGYVNPGEFDFSEEIAIVER